MFNETFSSGVDKGGGSERNEEQYAQKVMLSESSPALLQKGDDPIEQAGDSSLEINISTPSEGKRVDKVKVVGPQTPSPPKQKRVVRRSLMSWINKLRSNGKAKKSKNWLIRVAKEVENAPYYTRSINKLVIRDLICREEPTNQLSMHTNQQQKSSNLLIEDNSGQTPSNRSAVPSISNTFKSSSMKKNTTRMQKFGLHVQRDVTRAWKVLLGEGATERIEGTAERSEGVCPEVLFIYKVGDILGRRVHTPWKGSVLDSVIGTLLSQRVGDNTSSSAFMSLGMNFPQHPACDQYSRHHRILRGKRSNASSSQRISPCSIDKFLRKQGNVPKLDKQNKMQLIEMNGVKSRKVKIPKGEMRKSDWKKLREDCIRDRALERDADKIDYVDWYAVMRADVDCIAEAILVRGMNKRLAARIKDFLNRLVLDHGNLDLEWLRNADPHKAKDFLLSIYGFGVKSAECVRLLTLRQPAFPVDINVARVTVRLGWVPVPPVSDDIQMHLLEMNSSLHDFIHRYLWTRLSKLDKDTLYQLHCHMITFGKVFCTKQKPNCVSCPMRSECRYYSNIDVRPSPSFLEMDIEDLGSSLASMATKHKLANSKSESERHKDKVKETPIDVLPEECVKAPNTPTKVSLPRCTFSESIPVKVRQPVRNKTRTEHFM
ncbi:hypothetical protein vseg_001869 [Gypsophila vaccaria]